MSKRKYELKSTLARADLRANGIDIDDEIFTWENTYHESSSLLFTENAQRKCDECLKYFIKGELISKGDRQLLLPDSEVDIEGDDYVHLKCENSYKDKTITDILHGEDVTQFANFSSLTREQKVQFLSDAGRDISLADVKLPLEGFKFVITGEFRRKEYLEGLITSNGGSVSATVTKKCTHCLLGETGETIYGQITGEGSKKHKEAKKMKCIMVSPAELHLLIKPGVEPPNETVVTNGIAKAPAANKNNKKAKKNPKVTQPPSSFQLKDKVEALYYSGSTFYPGTITGINWSELNPTVTTYQVTYDDGDRELSVLEVNIRLKVM